MLRSLACALLVLDFHLLASLCVISWISSLHAAHLQGSLAFLFGKSLACSLLVHGRRFYSHYV